MDLSEVQHNGGHRHPWELSRAQSILNCSGGFEKKTIADIGAGDMFFTRTIDASSSKVYACDIHFDESDVCDHEEWIVPVKDMSAIPHQSIQLVYLLDVLEHVEDEDSFLKEIKGIMAEGGRMVLTVPAHQFLFGEHDIFLRHCRRYGKKNLRSLLEKNGFVIETLFSFYTSLFVLRLLGKFMNVCGFKKKYATQVSNWKYAEHHPITRMLTMLLNMDFSLNFAITRYLRTSAPGLSLCAIVKKSA